MTTHSVKVQPILRQDLQASSAFLSQHMNQRVSSSDWTRLLAPPWTVESPNRGFQLVEDGHVVGVYAAVYSSREVAGRSVNFCNLAAFCVLKEYRAHGVRLLRALLAQRGYVFTDFSPSGNVVAMNEQLGFRHLDTATKLVMNLPILNRQSTSITENPKEVVRALSGRDAEVFEDHRDTPTLKLLVQRHAGPGFLVFRRNRRKGLPVFASPLYIGHDTQLSKSEWKAVRSHLILKHALTFTLAEARMMGDSGGLGRTLLQPRPKMLKGDIADSLVDYLYSEMALVNW